MNWKSKHINLGIIAPETKHILTYQALEELDVKDIIVSCGCMNAKYDEETRKVTLTYVSAGIPVHLRGEGKYDTHKTLTVRYRSETQDVLSFSATVKK